MLRQQFMKSLTALIAVSVVNLIASSIRVYVDPDGRSIVKNRRRSRVVSRPSEVIPREG